MKNVILTCDYCNGTDNESNDDSRKVYGVDVNAAMLMKVVHNAVESYDNLIEHLCEYCYKDSYSPLTLMDDDTLMLSPELRKKLRNLLVSEDQRG